MDAVRGEEKRQLRETETGDEKFKKMHTFFLPHVKEISCGAVFFL